MNQGLQVTKAVDAFVQDRLVPVEDLPASLWVGDTMKIPPALAAAYIETIRLHSLEQLANARDPRKAPVGGPTREDADTHFAQQFDGSVARTEVAFLDPKSEVANVADALARACAGGRIAILDLPSGAGAFSLSILCALAELREVGTLPRMPLDVVVVGGEFNGRATQHANDLYQHVNDRLVAQAIHVQHKPMFWDVCDPVSTADVLKRFVADSDRARTKVVAVSNFSGFLKEKGKRGRAEQQINEVFRYCSGDNSLALWLEPQTNDAMHDGGILSWAVGLVKGKLRKVARIVGLLSESVESPATTEVTFALPLRPDRTAIARLAVLRFDLRAPTP